MFLLELALTLIVSAGPRVETIKIYNRFSESGILIKNFFPKFDLATENLSVTYSNYST